MLTNFTYTFSNNQSGFTLQVVHHYIYAHKSYWDYDTLHLGCVVTSAVRLLLLCDFIDVPTYFKQHKVMRV